MTNKRLARHVTVAGVTYGPGDTVPDHIAQQIKNPKAWVPLDAVTPEQQELADATARGQVGTASGHKLATTVTVGSKSYGPKDFLPDDVAAQIRNPKAWVDGRVPPGAQKAKDTRAAAVKTEQAEESKTTAGRDAAGATAETAKPADDKGRRAAEQTPTRRP